MTDGGGAELLDAYSEYTPFGSVLSNGRNNTGGPHQGQTTPTTVADRSGGFQHTSKELDETGLYYYDARYYDPLLGRFIEPDISSNNLLSQDLNRYSYALNNPIKYIDIDGMKAVLVDSTNRSQLRWYQDDVRFIGYDPSFSFFGFPSLIDVEVERAVMFVAKKIGMNETDVNILLISTMVSSMNVTSVEGAYTQATLPKVRDTLETGVKVGDPAPLQSAPSPKANIGRSNMEVGSSKVMSATSQSGGANLTEVIYKYHYTDAPVESFKSGKGLWTQSTVTDDPSLTAEQAMSRLGVKSPPNKILKYIDRGQFKRMHDVPDHPLGPGGGRQWTNPNPVPPEDLVEVLPVPQSP
jgi:RHS repeat-associated protein